MLRLLLLCVVGQLSLIGCSAIQTVPDLGNLYNKLARLLDLPMAPGVALQDLRDTVRQAGALDRVVLRFLGIPLELPYSQHIRQPSWARCHRCISFFPEAVINLY